MKSAIIALLAFAATPALAQPAADPQAVIAGLDRDGNGSVDVIEYLAFRNSGTAAADTDGHPGLSLDEFRASLDAPSRLTAETAFTRFDHNADGVLDADEVEAYHGYVFNTLLDLNHDGDWTVGELRALQASASSAASRPAGAPDPALAIAALDTDGDGSVSQQEYLRFQTARFSQFDSDQNGQLSIGEFTATLAAAARSSAQSTFRVADANRNGQLSQPEFLGYQVYVFDNALDRNRDGAWTVEEYRAFLHIR